MAVSMKFTFPKFDFIRGIIALCIVVAIVIPAISIVYIVPLFNQILIDNLERETAQTAKNLLEISMGINSGDHKVNVQSDHFEKTVERLRKENNLIMIKIYDQSGKITYCTDSRYTGTFHKEEFFFDVVANSRSMTHFVKRSHGSLEAEFLGKDVVESYVPIMRNGTFNGAFSTLR